MKTDGKPAKLPRRIARILLDLAWLEDYRSQTGCAPERGSYHDQVDRLIARAINARLWARAQGILK